ncbi:endolytic transglycosylase MltG [Pelagibius litoralis]|uniref:Endolytic murein transglycosylase n=1 Tax=Pelagibius litoralis TaxID=374515 RepID=A0A967EZH6_9PROT|nr:endolytic transglycosylase MltG [Pelagibius litoralis]NIA70301.1 endolytic transglycosylase MltG [Pelagibius litoralis]
MRRLGRLAVVFVVLSALGAGGLYIYLQSQFTAPGPLREETHFQVPRGAGLEAIAASLVEEGIVSDAKIFALGVRLFGEARSLQAGEFALPPAASMEEVAAVIASGKTVVHRLTVPEGLTSAEVLELLRAAEALEGDISTDPAEGSLLPETYHFARGDSREGLLLRMRESMQTALSDAWGRRAANLPINTPEEAVVLASIIERETGVDEERALVAGVFVNRLRKGMPLQSDPTVVYGITLGQVPLGRGLTRKDLDTPTAYNTYQMRGLPPAPIANPGKASLDAVVNPATTEYFYFVADGTGGHAFAKTLAGHNRNVAKWRKHLKSLKKKTD